MKKLAPFSLRARRLPILGAVLAFLLFSSAALADDTPFSLESSSWMSFDRYKEQPSNWLAPDQRARAEGQAVIVPPPVLPASLPNLKEPDQPIETPPLPNLNRNFDIRVDSTADDHVQPIVKLNKDDDKDVAGLPDSAWKNASDVAHQSKTDSVENVSSANVRFTSLPPWFVPPHKDAAAAMTPVPAKPPAPVIKVAEPAPPPPPPPVNKADAAACAALDAYKKRQLEAIESDRQTLTALQNAIAQLGLQKQLDFLPGAGGSLQTAGSGSAKN
jgi:hypothetical protein